GFGSGTGRRRTRRHRPPAGRRGSRRCRGASAPPAPPARGSCCAGRRRPARPGCRPAAGAGVGPGSSSRPPDRHLRPFSRSSGQRIVIGGAQAYRASLGTGAAAGVEGGWLRVALAQLNTVVGDIPGNARRVADAVARATGEGAALVLVPELAITGYPPEDLLLRPRFAQDSRDALDEIALGVREGVAVIGFAEWDVECYNSAAVVADGRVQAVYRKRFLPNYGVFDEARYFAAGDPAVVLQGARAGGGICTCRGN